MKFYRFPSLSPPLILPADRKCTNNVAVTTRTTARGASTGIVYVLLRLLSFSLSLHARSNHALRVWRSSVSRRPRNAVSLTRTVVGKSSSLKRKRAIVTPRGGRGVGDTRGRSAGYPNSFGDQTHRVGVKDPRRKKIPMCAPHVRGHNDDTRVATESRYMCILLIIRRRTRRICFTIYACVYYKRPSCRHGFRDGAADCRRARKTAV